MFGIIKEVVDATTETISDVTNVGLNVITLGEYGELSKENIQRLLDNGMTIISISESTGVGVDLIKRVLLEE